jgi:hypothetical protein
LKLPVTLERAVWRRANLFQCGQHFLIVTRRRAAQSVLVLPTLDGQHADSLSGTDESGEQVRPLLDHPDPERPSPVLSDQNHLRLMQLIPHVLCDG